MHSLCISAFVSFCAILTSLVHVDGFALRHPDLSRPTPVDATQTLATSADNVQYVGKTIESFKLADVYWLESCISAQYNTKKTSDPVGIVHKLAFHRPTASYLLGYLSDDVASRSNILFRPSKFQYIAKVIASGETPDQLLDNIRSTECKESVSSSCLWTISHDVFEPLYPKVSSTMLMCALSRVLPGEPILSGDLDESNVVSYMIIETSKRLMLVEKVLQSREEEIQSELHRSTTQKFRTAWSKRPFQYSGAINLDLAFTIADILSDMLQLEVDGPKTIRMLDPTCGSGTFLAVAMSKWSRVANIELVGIDSNQKCSSGTVSNLIKVLSVDSESVVIADANDKWILTFPPGASSVPSRATIHSGDSTRLNATTFSEPFDCAVTNLPWNRNTVEYSSDISKEEGSTVNTGILKAVSSALKSRAPIVVVSVDSSSDMGCDNDRFDVQACLEELGFQVVRSVSVPPKGYTLPSSNKKYKNTPSKKLKGSSNCSVFIALAP